MSSVREIKKLKELIEQGKKLQPKLSICGLKKKTAIDFICDCDPDGGCQ